ncbi:MAG TPA: YidC family membrane integrase SpoIIIJ [Pseudogracilibacillus sp.]|nr:YidC family membrane integrase SpoIIIJ [Pseudogracilibacillus sp.]
MRNKSYIVVLLVGALLLLSGCTEVNQPIDAESTGIWNEYFVYPLSLLIKFFADLFNGSYGLAIVVVTIIIRVLLLPLMIKQIKSTQAMQEVQPEIKALQEKYSSKDAKTQQKLQEETMKLFQERGVNPFAGCLPIFVQMPILIAMYHAIMRTFEIREGVFLWFELGSPDYILPLIAGGATFLQQKLMMSSNSAAANNPQMTMMLYMMPIMITVIAFFFPSALALYWVVGNIFMVAQTLFIRNPMVKEASNGGDKK